MQQAVFLDRDGTLNAMVYNPEFGLVDSPANPSEFTLLPGAAAAIRRINEAGMLAVVVSNQPGVAKGKFSPAILEQVTQKMHRELQNDGAKLDRVYYCLHHPQATVEDLRLTCECRKPKPGMLIKAAQELDIDLARSFMVGDGLTDIQAGRSAGVKTVFLSSRKEYIFDEMHKQDITPDLIVANLEAAVEFILNQVRRNHDVYSSAHF